LEKDEPMSLLFLSLINAALSMFIAYPLLSYGGNAGPIQIFQFASHFLALNLALCFVLFIVSFPFRRTLKYLGFICYSLLQIFLFIDVRVYELFHFHVNPLVWNTITTEDFSDSVILGHSTLLSFFLRVASIFLAEVVFVKASIKAQGILEKRLKIAIVLTCLLIIAADKVIYAFGNVYNTHSVTRASRLYPLYQPLKADKIIRRLFKLQIREEDELKPSSKASLLNYPKNPLVMKDRPFAYPNIVMIVVEGLRYDMLDPEIMPNLWKFSRENITFRNHYSGGNGSRAGVFSLLYGLQGTYWHSFLIERKSPVLIDSLLFLNYNFKVLSATGLNYPEFRKTAFVKIPGSIDDKHSAKGSERDRIMTAKFSDFLSGSDSASPFFSFLFFNASHQPYDYPKDFEKFMPVSGKEINYAKEMNAANIDPLKNRYKNSLYFDDSLFGMIFSTLRQKNLLKNTIVIITGDHGEEFYEEGSFGHTSSFDDYQTKVVFVMHMPGMKKTEISRLTSHLDVVPTLMKELGYANPVSDYSQGVPLLDTAKHPYVLAAGWERLCLIDENVKIVFSTESYRNLFEVLNSNDYKPAPEPERILKQKKDQLLDVLTKMSEFYR
jgi:membrane-anchored protein YejM (alkaline phosphatase superfamily)